MVEKEKINVIDLDKTLIPYDSFRLLVLQELKKGNIYFTGVTLLRIFRLFSSRRYKEKVSQYFQKKYSKEVFENFANKLYNDIDNEVLQLINTHTHTHTINILLSASPHFFVKDLIEKLNWQGSGSFSEANVFVHLYKKEKINWLARNYSPKEYNYNFAISDSSSDGELLALFRKSILWVKN